MQERKSGFSAFTEALGGEFKATMDELFAAAAAEIRSLTGKLNTRDLTMEWPRANSANSLLGKKKLDREMGKVLKRHLKRGGTIQEFFEGNSDLLGSPEDYDLQEFTT